MDITIKGLRWYKTDLHLHTIASKCFSDKTVTAIQWVDRCLEQGLNCVAVTDHNSGEMIDEIKHAAENKDLIVFPGVEITCGDSKVHILGIFDTDKGTEFVSDFLIRLGIDKNDFGEQIAYAHLTTIEVLKKINDAGGIAIPAHIDQFNGLCEIAHQPQKEIFDYENLYGVQAVHKSFQSNSADIEIDEELDRMYGHKAISQELISKWKKAINHAKEYSNLSILTFSDNPEGERASKHGLWGIGQRYTFLKMDEKITLESLRQALLMPELRVINDFSDEEPQKYPMSWIRQIRIKNTILNPNEEEIVNFSPQMTTIIGGRGTGKSCILRFIRGVFEKNNELEAYSDLINEQANFYNLSDKNGQEKGVFNENSQIQVSYMMNGSNYILTASKFTKINSCLTELKKWNEKNQEFEKIDEQNVKELIKIFYFDIFSQKQIYELSKKTNVLRDKIDTSIQSVAQINDDQRRRKINYLTQAKKIRTMKSEINQKGRIKAEIENLSNQLDRISKGNYQQLFEAHKIFVNDYNHLKIFEDSLKEKFHVLDDTSKNLSIESFDSIQFSDKYSEELNELIQNQVKKYRDIVDNFAEITSSLDMLIKNTTSEMKITKWFKEFEQNHTAYTKSKSELGPEGVKQLQNLEELSKGIEQRKMNLKRLESLETEITNEVNVLNKIKDEYESNRSLLTQERHQFLHNIIRKNDKIKIEIKEYRDKEYFEKEFRRIIQRPDKFNQDINKLVEFCFKGNVKEKVPKAINMITKIKDGEDNDFFSGKFLNVLRDLNDEQIDTLQLLWPEDKVEVKYKDNQNKYRPLSNASAGQKTSSILTFLLSYGDTPLILDQPEDDLDNNLIYELIVERLKSNKMNRQIITVTHNANIPVNGDSELIISMDSESPTTKIKVEGSIESPNVKNEICTVMEGGIKAFEMRAKRYDLPYSDVIKII